MRLLRNYRIVVYVIFQGGEWNIPLEEILQPLDFLDSEQCIDYIKGKFAKTIKKGAIRNFGLLEIIHIDICGPFLVTSVDGYDSFITFTNDFSLYGYIYAHSRLFRSFR